MKAIVILYLFLLIVSLECLCQKTTKEEFRDMFGERLELFADSTFEFTWNFDLASSWTVGSWQLLNDTIFLETILIMDTLTIRDSNNKVLRDSFVLSADHNLNRIEMQEYIIESISGGGQNRRQPPSKLFLKNKKLYRISDNGRLDRSKSEVILKKGKYKTYFKLVEK